MDISVSVCLCVFVWLRISPARIKLAASNFARWLMGVVDRESPILGNFAPPEAQNRTNGRAAATIADRRQSLPLTARSPSVEGTGVYQQYLPSACVDIWSSPKTDVHGTCFCFSVSSSQALASVTHVQ